MPLHGWQERAFQRSDRVGGFRRLKTYQHLPVFTAALAAYQSNYLTQPVEDNADVA